MSGIGDLLDNGQIPYSSSSSNNNTTQAEHYLVNRVSQIDKTSKLDSLAKACVKEVVNQKKETFNKVVTSFNTDIKTSNKALDLLNKHTK